MIEGLLGTKLGMTQIFNDAGVKIPVTLIEAGPCCVIQLKTADRDGYVSVQIGYGKRNPKRVKKSERGHSKKANVVPPRILREFKVFKTKGKDEEITLGSLIDVSIFEEGELVDIAGTTKGRGFAGVVKRYNFGGGPASHGSSTHRAPGAIGQCAWPGKVVKGKKMPGHMGNKRRTMQKLKVFKVDVEKNLLIIKGSIPGPNGRVVEIIKSRKAKRV